MIMKKFICLAAYLMGMFPLLLSCTENVDIEKESMSMATLELDVCVASSVISRSIDETSAFDTDNWILYAFQNDVLLWTKRPDDTNVRRQGNKLYIEETETEEPVELLMVANVDLSKAPSFSVSVSKDEVIDALSAFDYDCSTWSGAIPMTGETVLAQGITLGSKAEITLRRSLVKICVKLEYDNPKAAKFTPMKLQVVNVNKGVAVYGGKSSSSGGEVCLSKNLGKGDLEVDFEGYKAEIFVGETVNTKHDNDRTTVLIGGTMGDDNNIMHWYRLDLILESETEEIDCLLRNHYYVFTVRNLSYTGCSSAEVAFAQLQPDNTKLPEDTGGAVFDIKDEEILSITSEYSTGDQTNPYYIGVSEPRLSMRTTDEVIRVTVVTNVGNWGVDGSLCSEKFDFVPDIGNGTLWIWRKSSLNEGENYYFYIVASSIRKPMIIEIKEK